MPHIFLSKKSEESDFALLVRQRLEAEGFEVRTDDDIPPGSMWREEIDEYIRTALAVVVIMSPEARASEYVTYEWACAWGAGIPVIPIIYRSTPLHPRLESLQVLDFTHRTLRPWEELIKRLKAIQATATAKPLRSIQASDYSQLLEELFSPDELEQIQAIEQLVTIGTPALRTLHRVLKSKFWERRLVVVRVLKEIADPNSASELITILFHDPELEVRFAAEEALEAIGTDEALKAIHQWRLELGEVDPRSRPSQSLDDLPF